MTDGIGTTTYNYYPVTSSPTLGANLIASVNSPVAGSSTTDTVAYTYDALNRVASYSINGGTPQATSFDALGRVASVTNPLDTFNYGYSDGTSRVTSITSSSGPNTSLTYVPPQMTGGEQLQQVTFAPNVGMTNLAQFTYTYNADQLVTSLATALTTTDYFYDAANRLTSAVPGTGTSNSYQYDYASNLTAITSGSSTQPYSYTSTNEITSESYDANGSPTVVGSVTYKWDGDNRLVRYTNPSTNTSSSFVYDGLSRLVRVVDANTQTGTITADHSYLWCGANRCLAHDNLMGGAVSTQYFAQGEILSGTGYYYVTDQLGSIEQLVNASGTIVTQYAYDPYGNQSTVVGGTVASDLGYAGYFNHAASGLNFTRNRAYDPVHARWINRDPIGEAGGINLYAYVGGNPLTYRDPSGEFWGVVIGAGIGAIAGYEAGGYTGAAVGLVAGGITGFVAPWLSGEAATLVAGYVGGEGVASAAAAVATFEVTGVGAAAGATAITNAIQGNPIGQDIGWAVTVGALAPLASGEVGIVAAGESVVGETAANIFSGITGLWGIVGAAIDPNSSNGIITNNASCAK
jgi:RHS repeat-associated protein